MDYARKCVPSYKSGNTNNYPKAYIAINKDEKIRKESSSGGIFSLIAQKILGEDKGIVFGAAFDKDFNVNHIGIDSEQDLHKLRTSKYVQSNILYTYQEAEKYLKSGKKVLFTGTPCQVEGLKSYLMKEYENLYTQDIICHGVPSPLIWNKYKEYRKKVDKESPLNVNFRNKDNGWHQFNLKFSYNNKEYSKNQNNDLYMKAFLNNLILRDSCYKCSFKKYNRNSDITLADFWGIENIKPEVDDNKGMSLIIVNSEKGEKILENLYEKCILQEMNMNEALRHNKSFTSSAEMNKNREKFMKRCTEKNFKRIVIKYVDMKKICTKVKNKIKRMLKK